MVGPSMDAGSPGRSGPFEPWPDADVHAEWGVTAASLAAARGDIVCIVDVLSFSTFVTLATDRGASVIVLMPDAIESLGGRATIAGALDANVVPADRRSTVDRYTLSSATAADAEAGDRIVVMSLNGGHATCAAAAAPAVAVGCLANARAAAATLHELRGALDRHVTLVPCGEQWQTLSTHDGLRPALEDWLAVGAIAHGLADHGADLSPEAGTAALLFSAVADVEAVVHECISGRELAAKGFVDDVRLAARVDSVSTTPVRVSDAVLGSPGAVFEAHRVVGG